MADDPNFRPGAQVWLVGGDNGDGFENRQFYGLTISGRVITKWASTVFMHNYRCAWIPPPMQPHVVVFRGIRDEVETWAKELDVIAHERREAMTKEAQS